MDTGEISQVLEDVKVGTSVTSPPGAVSTRRTRSRSGRRHFELGPLLGISNVLLVVGVFLLSLMAARFLLCLHGRALSEATARGLYSGVTSRMLSEESSKNIPELLTVTPFDPDSLRACYVNTGFSLAGEERRSPGDTGTAGGPSDRAPTDLPSLEAAPRGGRFRIRRFTLAVLILATVIVAAAFTFFVVTVAMGTTMEFVPVIAGLFLAAGVLALVHNVVFLVNRIRKRSPIHVLSTAATDP